MIAGRVPVKRDAASLEFLKGQLKNAIVLVGGDNSRRALNDTYIINY